MTLFPDLGFGESEGGKEGGHSVEGADAEQAWPSDESVLFYFFSNFKKSQKWSFLNDGNFRFIQNTFYFRKSIPEKYLFFFFEISLFLNMKWDWSRRRKTSSFPRCLYISEDNLFLQIGRVALQRQGDSVLDCRWNVRSDAGARLLAEQIQHSADLLNPHQSNNPNSQSLPFLIFSQSKNILKEMLWSIRRYIFLVEYFSKTKIFIRKVRSRFPLKYFTSTEFLV